MRKRKEKRETTDMYEKKYAVNYGVLEEMKM